MRKNVTSTRLGIALATTFLLLGGCEKMDTASSLAHDSLVDVAELGAVAFPNSGAPDAQDAFHRGLLLLHSFEYQRAAEAFVEAQEIDPDFAMAYWGEAMTYNHPIWSGYKAKDMEAALLKLAGTPEERLQKASTQREKMYLGAVETLLALRGPSEEIINNEMCSSGQSKEFIKSAIKLKRDVAYMEDMQMLHEAYPDDDEARSLYGLSILGSQSGTRDFTAYMRAGAVVQPVFEKNPRHPGAAHYIIHSFDDPVHAPLGLKAADAYAEIAPNAAHAQHMTSHIFVALGMWERTVTANLRAKALQDAEIIQQGKKPNVCKHYPAWLHYGYLMLGEFEKAKAIMDLAYEHVMSGDANNSEWSYFTRMRIRHLTDTEEWSLADRWSIPKETIQKAGKPDRTFTYRASDAFAALRRGNSRLAQAIINAPRSEKASFALQIDQLAGLIAIGEGKTDEGIALLQKAAKEEDNLPLEFGPPEIVKPTFELLGEELLKLGRIEEAETAFKRATERTPRRPMAVKGLELAQR